LTESKRQAWGFSLFADDIRAEIGGKLSVLGIYQSEMVFASNTEFPFVYPKFCILLKYYETKDAFSEAITARIFLPGDPKDSPSLILPFDAAVRNPPNAPAPPPMEEDQERIFNFNFPIVLSPFVIKQEGYVKVRIITGTTTTNLGSLMIRKARPEEVLQFSTFPALPFPQPPPPAEGA